ncbi:MAG: protein kinase, partial [Rhodococcus sp. (in: high G+C Gram-positive bacteria)]
GTPAYFAPEVARGQDPTEASDVFSLGATLYTAIEGRPPFDIDQDSIALLHRVARGQIIEPTRTGDLTQALLHMLEPDPARRPTMAQARDEIITTAISSRSSIVHLRGAPLTSSDGTVPAWAHRSTPVAEARRPSREFDSTIAGLPAVRSGGPAEDHTPKPYAPPPFDPPKKKSPLDSVLDRIDDVVADRIDVSPAVVLAVIVAVVVLLLIVLIAVL